MSPGIKDAAQIPAALTRLHADVDACAPAQRAALLRRWQGLLRRARAGQPFDRGLEALALEVQRAQAQLSRRRDRLPAVDFPEALPVSARRVAIAEAIAAHQVVVIAGETGSGKTTQLPKICLQLGRGIGGQIAHTQPRRIAARSVAARIAEELKTPLGQAVGYKVRFSDRSSPDSYIKLMTDGILLAEIQGDRELLAYDTIIIDEAHERSLNIDFLLGYLKQLLPRRPDLKLIITSATINTERFAEFFCGAPVLEVSGRTYPVEIRYRPLFADSAEGDADDRDLAQATIDAIAELTAIDALGDILIFLPGEREIRELDKVLSRQGLAHTEILPLFGRLAAGDQDKVFKAHGGRRIVLATNVAETSLTVPGIRFVIDTGLARISRYSPRSKIQRLPIEPISQASANQRAGRCGRVSSGVCIRLYGEDDYLARPHYTDPEIRRTHLAAVILQMAALKLGEVDQFPFPDAPDHRAIADGFQLLHELGAIEQKNQLTTLGRQLARLPLDPRLGRMLLAASEEGSLRELLIIVSALAVQDPRERPLDKQQQADQMHARFGRPEDKSDFLAWLKLWDYSHEQARHLTQGKLRALYRKEFLSYVRLREWRDIHGQLLAACNELELGINAEPADYAAIHRALLCGLLGQIAMQGEEKQFLGARQTKVHIFPGSSQFKKPPKWIVAAELIATTRLYARGVAAIDPAWLEGLAAHLTKRSYSEPHWEKRAAQAVAYERITLYGLPIVERRRVNLAPLDPALARELFIRHALVEGDYSTRAAFFAHNRRLLDELDALEAKARTRDIQIDEQALFDFYDAQLPQDVHNGKKFEKWYRQASAENPRLLCLRREDLLRPQPASEANQFPDRLHCDGLALNLSYRFEPGAEDDGVTAIVPLAVLGQLSARCFERLVPGLFKDRLIALIKTLPKSLRRNFVPAVNFAEALFESLPPEGDLLEAIGHQLKRMTAIEVPADAWQPEALPAHLQMNFRVVDERGKTLGAGRSLDALQENLSRRVRQTLKQAAPVQSKNDLEREGLSDWDFGPLPESLEVQRHGLRLRAWPALCDEGASVAIRLFESSPAAATAQAQGLLRLFMLRAGKEINYLRRNLPQIQAMCLHYRHIDGCEALKDDLVHAICRAAFLHDAPWPRTRDEFLQRLDRGKARLVGLAQELCAALAPALAAHHALRKTIAAVGAPAMLEEMQAIKAHLETLLAPRFVRTTPWRWLLRYPVYLKALEARADKCGRHPAREREQRMDWQALWRPLAERMERASLSEAQIEYRWLLEELCISWYAQELKTVQPVSLQRLQKRWTEIKD